MFAAAKVKDEDGDEYRAFVRVKSNLGPDGGGFRYTLEPVEFASGIRGLRILWGDPLTGEARQILAEADADETKRSAYRDAGDFSARSAPGWRRPGRDIKREAEQAGHAGRTVRGTAANRREDASRRHEAAAGFGRCREGGQDCRRRFPE